MAYEFSGLVPELRPFAELLIAVASDAGLNPKVTSTRRSYGTQKRLYLAYLQGRSPYPAAPPGFSPHQYGWAFDLVVNDDSAYSELGALWTSWGGSWGGRYRDPIHFELPGATEALRSS